MRIVTPKEMREIERSTFEEYKLSESLIIESVGIEAAFWINQKFIENYSIERSIIFLLGKGNNGADGLAIARHLVNKNSNVKIMAFSLYPVQECSREFKQQYEIAEAFGLRVAHIQSVDDLAAYMFHVAKNAIVVDALFGSGIRLPLPNNVYDVIRFVNENASITISIDIPSGVEGESGKTAGSAITATHTLDIGAPKLGCFIADGVTHTGELHLIDAGFPKKLFSQGDKFQIDPQIFQKFFFQRSKYAHKNSNGHTLVIGGSLGLTGALILASQSALRVGSGLVTAVTWEENHLEYLVRQVPEIMSAVIPKDDSGIQQMIDLISRYDAVVIGPGLGKNPRAKALLNIVLTKYRGPLVIDADAIKLLDMKEDAAIIANRKAPTILTPHIGEFADLVKIPKADIFKNSIKTLKDTVHNSGAIILLKGPCTSIALPSGKIYFNLSPNEAMATGGTGDVLAGIIGGLLAQGNAKARMNETVLTDDNAEFVVLMSVCVHSQAGKFAKDSVGARYMSASDLMDNFTPAFNSFENLVYDKN